MKAGPRRELRSVAVTGASGFLGRALTQSLQRAGVRVVRLVRRPAAGPAEIAWDPGAGTIEAEKLEGIDAVVHLAGESIAGIWTPAKKRRILESRRAGTQLVAEALGRLGDPPATLVSASGIDYYGDRGDEVLTESDPPGEGFISDVCVQWESATAPAADRGIRVVRCRMGLVIHPSGGALRVMLPIFKLGLGARVGSGRQWLSWVSLEDAVGAFVFALENRELEGPVNVVAPEPVRNRDFTRAVAESVGRPAILAIPGFAAAIATGGMADALLLSSTRAAPDALQRHGFKFSHRTIQTALRPGLDGNG